GARARAERLRSECDRPPFAGRIDSIRTIDDVLPSRQEEKLSILADIREDLTPRVRESLTPDQRDYVKRFLGSEPADTITLDALPRSFALGLRERDGSTGKIVLVSPSLSGA